MEEYLITCASKRFFALPCPGCGGQRAVLLLLEGKWSASFLMYPGLFPLLFLILCLGLNFLFPHKKLDFLIQFFGVGTALLIAINYLVKIFRILLVEV